MKLKTWHLFLVIIILFGCSFYVVNLHFDKFYRLNGINNDNRVLIEKYLSDDEQEYLIDNQISIDLFIDYIEYDDFQLVNYQYYNLLKETHRYSTITDILETGNSLATRLDYLYRQQAFDQAKVLVHNVLEEAFLNTDNFNFDYIDIYTSMKSLYQENDYSFVQDSEKYILILQEMGYDDLNQISQIMEMLTRAYNQQTLADLMATTLPAGVQMVFAPYELDTLVNQQNYIGKYEPRELLLVQDIPRVSYTMYLQKDAYNALLKLYTDLSKEYKGFLLRSAYQSPQTLDEKEVGYNEMQLGLTIEVTQSELAYQEFENTEMSKWLEEHAYEYGFILRYPQRKASITNHAYDAHIYRYVGKSLAKSLHDSNLTLEEYQSQNKGE